MRRRLEPARRRALELLAASPDGCTEGIMRAHGFSIDFLVSLVRSGLAAATAEHVVSGPDTIEVARMRITDAGRHALGTSGSGGEPMVHVTRRQLITLLGGTAAAWPLAARAQQGERMRRIGIVANEEWPPLEGLRQGLRELGYIDGKNIHIEYRFAEGRAERYSALVAELVAMPVDLIVTQGTPASLAARKATSSIPIVMSAGDPVAAGLVTNLSRPGRNLTGVSTQGAEMEAKRVELLKELLPSLTRIVVLSNPTNPYCVLAVRDAKRGAAALRIQLDVVNASEPSDLDSAFAAIARARPGATIVIADAVLAGQRDQIAGFMLAQRLPSMYTYREYVDSGGLVSYSTSYFELFRREAVFIDKIFKGVKPGDIPIEQPTKFELLINLKTAKALGLTVPPTLLARADEVLE
jgi:putative ABC transport system substrate-binding protein